MYLPFGDVGGSVSILEEVQAVRGYDDAWRKGMSSSSSERCLRCRVPMDAPVLHCCCHLEDTGTKQRNITNTLITHITSNIYANTSSTLKKNTCVSPAIISSLSYCLIRYHSEKNTSL